MKIITGYTGEKHITAADDAGLTKGLFGDGDYVLSAGSNFEATAISANKIRIADGELVMQGRHARIESAYDTLTIANGAVGLQRNDLIVARYMLDVNTRIESIDLVVIQGTASSIAADPACNTGNIDEGEMRDFPLYRVRLDGITISGIEPLFEPVLSLEDLRKKIENDGKDIADLKGVRPVGMGGTGANTAKGARKTLETSPVLLWTNPVPTREFVAQTIDLDDNVGGGGGIYPLYLVIFRASTGIVRDITKTVRRGVASDVQWMENIYTSNDINYHGRKFTIYGLTADFDNSFTKEINGGLSGVGESGDKLIPVKIYGIHAIEE